MRTIFTLILCSVAWVATAQEKRLALIIGNADYHANAVLKNPVNDARAMDETLTALGFHTLRYENLRLNDLKKAIDDFGKQLPSYEVGLFYYAGHGIQYKGRNYLVPVDAELTMAQQVEFDCVPAERMLAYMESSGTDVNLLILDACRNNPFETSWNRSVTGSGLAFMNAPSGSLIAYATAPGSVASDGSSGHGLYTSSLLHHIVTPNITIEQVFKRVRADIETRTNGNQTPWESTSLKGDFYFLRDSLFNYGVAHDLSVQGSSASRDVHVVRRHALKLQAEVPVMAGLGYEYQVTRNLSAGVQAAWLGQPNNIMMVNLMGKAGNSSIELMINNAFKSGLSYESGVNYHFGNNYVGGFFQVIDLQGAVATTLVETNFDTDISLTPVKPGRPETKPLSVDLSSRLFHGGIVYGRRLPLKNPNWQIRLEFSIGKNFGSRTSIYSPDRDLSSVSKEVDAQFDSWFTRYGYMPALTVALTRPFGKQVR